MRDRQSHSVGSIALLGAAVVLSVSVAADGAAAPSIWYGQATAVSRHDAEREQRGDWLSGFTRLARELQRVDRDILNSLCVPVGGGFVALDAPCVERSEPDVADTPPTCPPFPHLIDLPPPASA